MRIAAHYSPSSHTQRRGFTIVELLIVVVVIAILASITFVSFNGIQARARDSVRLTALRSLTNGLEMYWLEAGHYPNACNAFNAGCAVSNLSADLAPAYLSTIPADPGPGQTISYVVGGEEALWGRNYGIYVKYETKTPCKYLRGLNPPAGWWPDAPICST